jgi:DNA-binding transcriptional ArsR family regulator
MSAGAIAAALDLAAPSLSFHLKELSHAGLIEGHSQGRHIMYSANYDTMQALIDFLLENCCAAQGCACASNATEALE